MGIAASRLEMKFQKYVHRAPLAQRMNFDVLLLKI